MEFKSRTALHEFFLELEREGWIERDWIVKPHTFVENGVETKGTRATRVFKINFNRVGKNHE